MKTILVAFLLSISFFGKAQSYAPFAIEGTHWFLTPNVPMPTPPPYQYFEYYLSGDTVVLSVNYKKVYYRSEWSSSGYGNMTTNFSLYALLREDTNSRKVYALHLQSGNSCPLNQEVLLYDFNLQIGDTIKPANWCLSIYEVQVNSILLGNNPWLASNTFYLSGGAGYLYEGVGSDYGPFEIIALSVSGSQPFLIDHCRGGLSNCKNFTNNINNTDFTTEFSVLPNPIEDNFIVKSSQLMDFDYKILCVNGVVVKQGKSKTNKEINLDIKKGIYFIKIYDNNGVFIETKKIIKSR